MNYPFKRVVIDIKNYLYIRRIIKNNQNSIEWQKFKLRVDWIGRIYTVINLPPEVLYSPDTPEEIRPAYVLEESKPLNEYLTGLNLQEIVLPSINPIPASTSYLLTYTPYFQRLSFRWVLYRLILILVLIWAQAKFGFLGWTISQLINLYEFIF
jgi:hypothetical protein